MRYTRGAMNLRRTILRLAAFLAGRRAAGQVRAFLAAHEQTRQVQDRLLDELLRTHAQTAFGRDHGFRRIRSYDEFRTAVPLATYETLRPYMQRVLRGETTALLPAGEAVLMFSMTSGTTGLPKHIPVSARFLAEMRRGWNIFGLTVLKDHPAGWLRAILQISSPMDERTSPAGVPCGAISGLLAQTQMRIVRRMYVTPPAVTSVTDPQAKYYAILRCGVGRDVGIITTANPASTIKLIEAGQANAERLVRDVADGTLTPPGEMPAGVAETLRFRPDPRLARRIENGLKADGVFLPRHVWDLAFLTNWTGGTLKLYLRRLRELFGDVPVRDIGLLASEGRFSIPIADGTPAGIAEITANFLEFIPAADYESENPPTLRAHELQIGAEYFLVVTNWAGLWRYSIDDRVRVVGQFARSPIFEFLSRGQYTANVTGEKITEHQVVEAMRQAAAGATAPVDRFVLQGRFAATPYYELRLELPDGTDADALADGMDKVLAELNMEYHAKRTSGRLGPIRPVVLPPGTLEQAEAADIRRRRGRSEQYKHQYLLTEVLEEGV